MCFLMEKSLKLKENERDIQVISVVDTWKHFDFLCRNYVMNALIDSLYNVYTDKKIAKEIWESLDRNIKARMPRPKFLSWANSSIVKW